MSFGETYGVTVVGVHLGEITTWRACHGETVVERLPQRLVQRLSWRHCHGERCVERLPQKDRCRMSVIGERRVERLPWNDCCGMTVMGRDCCGETAVE